MMKKFRKNTSGSIAVAFALIATAVIIAVGVGVDGSRYRLTERELQQALDAAALAVGGTYTLDTDLEKRMRLFAEQNFKVGGASITALKLTDVDGDVIVSGAAQLDTTFMRIAGFKTLDVEAITKVKRAGGGLAVALVLDNTGSMWAKKNGSRNIDSLRDSAEILVEQLFGEEEEPESLRVAMVPYASTVNLGAEAMSTIRKKDLLDLYRAHSSEHVKGSEAVQHDTDKTKWKGCVEEREGTLSLQDTPPKGNKKNRWTPYWYPNSGGDNEYDLANSNSIRPGGFKDSNDITGPNIGCPTPVTPLTNSRGKIDDAVSALTAWNRGGTLTDIGMAWGLRVMSPGAPFEESTEIDPSNGQALWDSKRWRKAIVLMTDGENSFYQSDYTGYNRLGSQKAFGILGTNDKNVAKNKVNDRVATLCSIAKGQGMIIYTIVFTSSVGSGTRDMFKNCASDPGKYWYAPDGNALKGAFTSIGNDLSKLRITR